MELRGFALVTLLISGAVASIGPHLSTVACEADRDCTNDVAGHYECLTGVCELESGKCLAVINASPCIIPVTFNETVVSIPGTCLDGACNSAFVTGTHCYVDEDCNDGAKCTADTCEDGLCVRTYKRKCCTSKAHCVGTDVCIDYDCDTFKHTCVEIPISNCCKVDADCDDGVETTNDWCALATHRCVHTEDLRPCAVALQDCPTNYTCTEGHCTAPTSSSAVSALSVA